MKIFYHTIRKKDRKKLFIFGLDFAHMEKVGELLKQLADLGKTVLVSTHDPELIEQCCDYELYIEKGRVGYFRKVENSIFG